MENSAYEALILGLNVAIFMVAVSVGMLLMTTINEMIDYTREIGEAEIGGNLMKEYGEQQEREFTGAEVYALYGQALKGELEGYTIRVNAGGTTVSLRDYGTTIGLSNLNQTFIMISNGLNSYTLKKKPED